MLALDSLASLGVTIAGALAVTPAAGALVLGGLATGFGGGVHCGLMCGPLAAAAAGAEGSRVARVAAWQAGRLLAYAAVGALLGGLGAAAMAPFGGAVQRVAPWLVAAGLALSAAQGFERRWLPAGVARGFQRLAGALGRRAGRARPWGRAALLGAATPLLPCGLLWGVLVAAAAAGTAANGALLLVAFALGSMPVLAGAGWGSAALGRWAAGAPRWSAVLRRGVPLLAAALVLWRGARMQASAPGGSAGDRAAACHVDAGPAPGAAISSDRPPGGGPTPSEPTPP